VGADVREYFAVKALAHARGAPHLREEGCGLDCASFTSSLAEACGFSGRGHVQRQRCPAEDSRWPADRRDDQHGRHHPHRELHKNGGIPETICLGSTPGHFRVGNAIMGDPGDAKVRHDPPSSASADT
jgi:diaminopimelate decarboxylase